MGNKTPSRAISPDRIPKISVIIPAYNAAPWLRECVCSVLLALDGIHSEVICIDDGSTDSTLEILNEFASLDARVRVIGQENLGRCAARNVGIENSRGEWLAFVDADDRLTPTGLRSILGAASSEGFDVVYGLSEDSKSHSPFHTRGSADLIKVGAIGARKLILDAAFYVRESSDAESPQELRAFKQLDFCSMWGTLYSGRLIRENGIRCCDGLSFGEDALFNFDILGHVGEAAYSTEVVYVQNIENQGTIRSYRRGDSESVSRLFPLWRQRVPIGDSFETDVASCLAREVMSIASRLPLTIAAFAEGRSLAKLFSRDWGEAVDPSRVGKKSSPYWPYWRLQYLLAKRGGPFLIISLVAKAFEGLRRLQAARSSE